MNLKSVLFRNFQQRRASLQKVSSTLQNSIQENEFTNDLTIDNLHNTATNNYLAMLEVEVRKHWGI